MNQTNRNNNHRNRQNNNIGKQIMNNEKLMNPNMKWSIEEYRKEWLKYKNQSETIELSICKKVFANFLKTVRDYNKKYFEK